MAPHGRLTAALHDSVNDDGGWPYYRSNSSRIEPSAWAALALGADPESRALTYFAGAQRSDGLLLDQCRDHVNFCANALALLALLGAGDGTPLYLHLAAALIRSKGVRLAPATQYCQNNRVQGWGWIENAFSWTEPTAWSVLALKKTVARGVPASLDREARARIAEGERMLFDRACARGGWNYGNANMFGRELHPQVPTTAIALLALQDRREAGPVRRGIEFLVRNRLAESSPLALALAAICLSVLELDASDVVHALHESLETTSFDRTQTVAVALIALSEAADACGAVRL